MAKNNKTPAQQAAERYQVKKNYDYFYTPEEKAKDRYKINKEYKKLEKYDKLPGFVITLLVFIIFIGVFAGLYNQYDYELELNPKEYTEIDLSSSSNVISSQVAISFSSFFSTLNSISNIADSSFKLLFSSDNLSDNPDVNIFLLSLKQQAYKDAEEKLLIDTLIDKMFIDLYIKAFSDPDSIHIIRGYFIPGSFHIDYAHLPELAALKDLCFSSWDVEFVHLKFVDLEICHRYNGTLYKYCDH